MEKEDTIMKKKLSFVIIIAVFTVICCAALQGCVRENVYSVTAEGSEFYDVALSSDKAAPGEKVTFTVTPAANAEITSVTMNHRTLIAVDGVYSFVMPDKAAIILIEYKLTDSGSAIVPAS